MADFGCGLLDVYSGLEQHLLQESCSKTLRLGLTWREGQGSEVEGFLMAGAGAQGSSGSLVAGSLLLQHTAGKGAAAALLLKDFIGAPQLVQARAWNLHGSLICTPASSDAQEPSAVKPS